MEQRRNTSYSSKRYYVEGNAVREINPEEERRQRQLRRQKEEERRRKSRRNAARRNQARAMHMSRGYVAFLTCCVLLVAFSAGFFVKAQAQMTHRMKAVAALESQVADLKADNDEKLKRIETSVDLEYIKDVAVNQLGMKYAAESQIVYYSVDNSNYMNQYRDIPTK